MTDPLRTLPWLFREWQAPVASAWAASIIVVWLLVALILDQPILQLQHSRDLAQFGAERGVRFDASDAWKLIASQWLHVKFPHMLFNALIIAVVGGAIERRYGWFFMLCAGIGGGALAQLATLLARPEAYVSGASQAYLALCGMALVLIRPKPVSWWAAVTGIAVSVVLDLFVSAHGALKIGHIVGLGAGLLAGALVIVGNKRWAVVKESGR
jgi:membrane associated rhomboid family serine protease